MPAIVIDPDTHRVRAADYIASPHADARPVPTCIDLIVVHAISLPPGEYGGRAIEQLFTNTLNPSAHPYYRRIAHLKVSAHVVIRRAGCLQQFVPFNRRAWHAGQSCYRGRERCNDFSIGIELEGCVRQPFAATQYHQLAQLVNALLATYPGLSPTRIVCHSDIAPGRKKDPGSHFERDFLIRYSATTTVPICTSND